MTALPEKQIVPASNNSAPNSLFFIPQSSISGILVGGNYGGERNHLVED